MDTLDEVQAAEERILLVDDEPSVLSALRLILENFSYKVSTATNGALALQRVKEEEFDIILCDLQMPEMDGLSFLREMRGLGIGATIIMMSAYGTIPIALEAIKLGAYDYISKPFNADEILLTIKKVQERERLRKENEFLRGQISRKYSFSNIVAQSASMHEIFETIKKISDYKTTVMLYGESGTGKELVARAIHFNSARKNKRFVAINCGAIPENLLESELFGHKRGAFTDATRDKKGLFEEAQGGTILLDEIGELPLHLQVKLLRVLQENEIRPVGDSRVIPIDVRVIAATLRDLEADVLAGRFRDDLYYRLNVISIRIPPLRERKEDIPVLVQYFIKKHQEKLKLPVSAIAPDALEALMEHEWKGNIRELENCIERAMILTDGDTINTGSLPSTIKPAATKKPSVNTPLGITDDNLSIKHHTRVLEEALITRALEKTKGNRTHAARMLEISHRTLLYKLKEYSLIDPKEVEESSAE